MLGESLSLIRSVDPDLYGEIMTCIGWYVPIVTSDSRIHRSYTREDVTGVMYLSNALDHILLAEAVIHEFYHTVLNLVTATEPVYEQGNTDDRFYSPWRDDPRPLHGLFHAIYVFSGVARFYALARKALAETVHEETVRLRSSKLYYQLSSALAQLPIHRLTCLGRDIVARIASQVQDGRYAPGVLDSGVAEAVYAHLEAWRKRNPDVAIKLGVTNKWRSQILRDLKQD
jgi:HEXXH motif-containing protein